jgi:predicted dienelactone hydrolase
MTALASAGYLVVAPNHRDATGNGGSARWIDWQRFGLIGHSLGGYTVLGLGGVWPSWKLDGVKAVLALSPYVQPFLVRRTPAGLGAPIHRIIA